MLPAAVELRHAGDESVPEPDDADLRAAFDGLQANGFDPSIGLRTQGRTATAGPGAGLFGFGDQVALGTAGKEGRGLFGPTNYGPNGTKTTCSSS